MQKTQAASIPAPELLTPGEAADRLRVTTAALAAWSDAGKIEAVILPSGHRRYRRAVIEAILTGSPAA